MINGRDLAAFLLDWRVGDDDGDTDGDDLDFCREAFRQRQQPRIYPPGAWRRQTSQERS